MQNLMKRSILEGMLFPGIFETFPSVITVPTKQFVKPALVIVSTQVIINFLEPLFNRFISSFHLIDDIRPYP